MARKIDPDGLSEDELRKLRLFAEISKDVYAPKDADPDQDRPRWRRLEDEDIRKMGIRPSDIRDASKSLFDGHSDFKAGIYRAETGEIVVAFAGTETVKDWYHNLKQGVGAQSHQYTMAASLARTAALSEEKITFTGHSLGGGMAHLASAVTDKEAVTFNPSGLHGNTLKRFGIDRDAYIEKAEYGLNFNVTTKGDALQTVNALPLVPSPQGQTVRLEGEALNGKGPIGRHSMDSVISVIDEQIDKKREAYPPQPPQTREAFLERGKALVSQLPEGPAREQARKTLEAIERQPAPEPGPSQGPAHQQDGMDRDF